MDIKLPESLLLEVGAPVGTYDQVKQFKTNAPEQCLQCRRPGRHTLLSWVPCLISAQVHISTSSETKAMAL